MYGGKRYVYKESQKKMLGSQIATNKFGNYTGNTYQGNFNSP